VEILHTTILQKEQKFFLQSYRLQTAQLHRVKSRLISKLRSHC
jgi:hypothetical protein